MIRCGCCRHSYRRKAVHAPAALPWLGRRIERALLTRLRHPLAKEADEMIDAEFVEERRGVPRPRPQPREAVAIHRWPVVGGEAPALPLGGEVVGRRAERHVGAELITMRPNVGALTTDDE